MILMWTICRLPRLVFPLRRQWYTSTAEETEPLWATYDWLRSSITSAIVLRARWLAAAVTTIIHLIRLIIFWPLCTLHGAQASARSKPCDARQRMTPASSTSLRHKSARLTASFLRMVYPRWPQTRAAGLDALICNSAWCLLHVEKAMSIYGAEPQFRFGEDYEDSFQHPTFDHFIYCFNVS